MAIWLPRRRTSVNPWRSRIWQTSRPERTRSLPMRRVEPRDEHLAVKPAIDLPRVGRLQEKLDRLLEIGCGLFDGGPLAGHVEFGAQGDIEVAFFFQNRRVTACGHRDLLFQPKRNQHWPDRALRLSLVLGQIVAVNPDLLAIDNDAPVLLRLIEGREPLEVQGPVFLAFG